MFVLPLLAVGVMVLSIFLSPEQEDISSALVLGGPTDSVAGFTGRLQVTHIAHGVERAASHKRLKISLVEGRHETVRSLLTDESGWTEFSLPRRPEFPLELTVTDEAGAVLATGAPQLSTERWLRSARRRGGEPQRVKRHGMEVVLRTQGGVLAVPFPSELQLEVRSFGPEGAGQGLSGVGVQLHGDGLTLLSPSRGKTDNQGIFRIKARAEHHSASLRVMLDPATRESIEDGRASPPRIEGETEGRVIYEQNLPVIPGALFPQPAAGGYIVRSPILREEAWFTFLGERSRLGGGRVKMSPESDGGSTGRIDRTRVPAEATHLVLSGSPDGRSLSTVGYPLKERFGSTLDAVDAFLIDGGPRVHALFEARQRRSRYWLGSYAAVSFLLTLVLFVFDVRRETQKLREGLGRVGASPGSEEQTPLPLVIAVVCLFFAFSLAVLWIVAR